MKLLSSDFIPSLSSHKLMRQEEFINIYYNFKDHWIYADWKGYQTTETIKEGSELLLLAIKQAHSKKLINDNTHLSGMKANVVNWLATEYVPRLEAAGLQYLSWIYKTNSPSETSADSVLTLSQTDILVIVFDKVTMAEKWLRTTH